MKQITFLSAILATLLCYACSDTNSKITGKIDNFKGEKIYLDYIDINQINTIDSIELNKNGQFTFKVKVDYPEFYQLRVDNGKGINILAEKDSTLFIQIKSQNENDYIVQGSTLSSELKNVIDRLNSTKVELSNLYSEMNQNQENQDKIDSLTKVASSLILKQINYSRRYIIDHAGSPVTYFVLYQKLNNDYILSLPTNLNYYRATATNLNKSYPEAKYSKFVTSHATRLLEQNTNEQLNAIIQNYSRDLPELKLKDSKGRDFDLEDLRGKTILLDFAMLTEQGTAAYQKELSEIQKRYSSKGLVIVQVCFDKSKILWERAKRDHNITWICLLDEEAENSKNLITWNITSIPANYIIDKEFKIVGKNQFGANLSDYIKDILK